MVAPAEDAITETLRACAGGDQEAWRRLAPMLYGELRQLADGYMRSERPEHTLQPTALVHELYLRLVTQRLPSFENRSHFFGLAARIMRQVLVDSARIRKAAKRGGAEPPVPERAVLFAGTPGPETDLLDLDLALGELARADERQAAAIEMHYFAGLEVAEIAEMTGRSQRSVARDLRAARLYLARALSAGR